MEKRKKIEEYIKQYQFLEAEYVRIIDQKLLSPSIEKFRKIFKIEENFTDIKVIDTIIWRFTTLLKNGAIRNGNIKYS